MSVLVRGDARQSPKTDRRESVTSTQGRGSGNERVDCAHNTLYRGGGLEKDSLWSASRGRVRDFADFPPPSSSGRPPPAGLNPGGRDSVSVDESQRRRNTSDVYCSPLLAWLRLVFFFQYSISIFGHDTEWTRIGVHAQSTVAEARRSGPGPSRIAVNRAD